MPVITKTEIKEAEAYCAEQDGEVSMSEIAHDMGKALYLQKLQITELERRLRQKEVEALNASNGWAGTLRENEWLRQQGGRAMDSSYWKSQLEVKDKRITELEGKIARAKDQLISSKLQSLWIYRNKHIDAALEELK